MTSTCRIKIIIYGDIFQSRLFIKVSNFINTYWHFTIITLWFIQWHVSTHPTPFSTVYEPSSLALHNITSFAASFTPFVHSLLEIIPSNLNNLKIQCFFSGLPHRKAVSIAFPHFMDQRFGAIPTAEGGFWVHTL